MKSLIKSLALTGLLAVLEVAPADAQNLIVNGAFTANSAAFTVAPGYTNGGNPATISGWLIGGAGSSAGLNGIGTSAGDAFGPTSPGGRTYAFLQYGGGLLRQYVTLAPSTKYRVDFDVAARVGSAAQYRVVVATNDSGGFTGLYYDSGARVANNAGFDHVTAYFTTPATLGANPNIQLLNVTGGGDHTVVYANVSLTPSARKPKLFLFAGQSNMGGAGDRNTLTIAEREQNVNVQVCIADLSHSPPQPFTNGLYWSPPTVFLTNYTPWSYTPGDAWNAMNPGHWPAVGNSYGPEFTAGRDIAAGLGEMIFMSKYALGGSGLDAGWGPGNGSWSPSKSNPTLPPAEYTLSLYRTMTNWANKALAAARQTEPETELAGFFWLQGEADASSSTYANRYRSNLTNLFAKLRSDYGKPGLPIVIGQIANRSPTYMPYAYIVTNAQAAVDTADTNAAMVYTDDVPVETTFFLHYTDAGYKTVGQRFAQAWLNLNRPPSVMNDSGASNIFGSSASLTGSLTATGGAPTQVTIYWGANNGGTNPAGWSSSISLGTRSVGTFAYTATNLAWGTYYHYRAAATNSHGQTWAPLSGSFTTLPVTLTCPPNVTVPANAGQCHATGVLLGTPTVNNNPGNVTVTNNAPAQFPTGVTTVTWTVFDSSGNTATCAQTVTVNDTQLPTITCPAEVMVSANDGCAATNVALGSPVTGDNCSVATVTNNAPTAYPLGTNVVTWSVTDGSGNTNTCAQRVIVQDTTAPTIICPADVMVSVNDGNTATNVTFGLPVTGDNCSVASVTNNAPAAFPLGTNVVTWSVTDGSGNTATCAQTVTVNSPPPAFLTISAQGGTVTITWDGGVLQEADDILGGYTDVPGAVSPYTNAVSGAQKFYRTRSALP